ncbi:MAG: LapA family protein [Pseudomonadota bacterium]
MKKFLLLLLLVPLGIVILALAVANRQSVPLSLPPELGFAPVQVPLFALLFVTLLVGMVVGSCATWAKQGKYRKQASQQKTEAKILAHEAQKQKARAEELAAEKSASADQEQRAFAALGLPAPSQRKVA